MPGDGAAMGGDFVDVHGVIGQGGADGGAQRDRVNGAARGGVRLGILPAGGHPVVFRRYARQPPGDGFLIAGGRRTQGIGQQGQPNAQIALNVAVREKILMHHKLFERGFAQRRYDSVLRAGAGRIPGGAAAGQQHQVGVRQVGRGFRSQVKRVVFGEVGVKGPAFDYRNGVQFRQRCQIVEPIRFPPGAVGDYQGRPALLNQGGQVGDVAGGGAGFGRGGDGAHSGRRRPGVQHSFNGDVQKSRALGNPLGQFAGAGKLAVEGMGAGGPPAPLGDDVGEAFRAAYGAQAAIPLKLGIQFRVFAVGCGLAGADQHWRFAQGGAVYAHTALQQPDPGVEQHRLHLAGDAGVASSDVHR